jgi:hypothetical protein
MVSFSLSFEVSHISAGQVPAERVQLSWTSWTKTWCGGGDHISSVYIATAFPQVEREQAIQRSFLQQLPVAACSGPLKVTTGLGPKSLAIGDEVWIMPRSHVPFILRKSPTGAPLGRYSSAWSIISSDYGYWPLHSKKDTPLTKINHSTTMAPKVSISPSITSPESVSSVRALTRSIETLSTDATSDEESLGEKRRCQAKVVRRMEARMRDFIIRERAETGRPKLYNYLEKEFNHRLRLVK